MSSEKLNTTYFHNERSYSSGEHYMAQPIFDNLKWLTTKETAIYLRKSVNAIHTLVCRKYLRPRKFANRLYFNKEELDFMLDSSIKGGF